MNRLRRAPATIAARARARWQARRRGVTVGRGVRFGHGVRCAALDGAEIVIGDGVEIGAGTSLTAQDGARLRIGDGVFISGCCTIAASGRLTIGADSMIAELVSIRDHDHDPAHPPKSGRTLQADVIVGPRVWIGAKATLTRGITIGDDAVVGAHAVVTRDVPNASLVAGVPARVIRRDLREV